MEGKQPYSIDTQRMDEEDIAGALKPMPFNYHAVLYTYKREPLFTLATNCNNLAYLIFETSTLHKYSLFAFCIMPDHVHILCQPGNIVLDSFIDLLKFRFEYILFKKGRLRPVWQSSFKESALLDEDIVKCALFIYENPVRCNLVKDAFLYPFSFVLGGKDYRP